MKTLRFVLSVCSLSFFGLLRIAGADPTPNDRVVVIISVDGLAGFYLDDPKAEMPNIRALAAEGARASGMKSAAPTVTWPTHATLITGVPPAVHGVVGNNFYDRAARQKRTLIADPVYDKDEIVKVPTLYDVAKTAGLKTAAIRWPASRNAKTLDWTVPAMKPGLPERRATTPSLLQDAAKAGVVFDDTVHDDVWCTRLFNYILKTHRPQLALLHIVDVDHAEHEHGPRSPEAYAAVKAADVEVGKVREVLKAEFPGRASLLVVSDHGFSPIEKMILPNVVLRQAGLVTGKPADASVQVVPQGGAALVYLLDEANREATAQKIIAAFRDIKEIEPVVETARLKEFGIATPSQNPRSPDLVLFAKEGFAFGDTSAGEIPFQVKPETSGTHGHNPNLPNLHATFVAWGAGIKSGVKLGEIDSTRVAPTAARLLGLTLPAPASAPLTEVLTMEKR